MPHVGAPCSCRGALPHQNEHKNSAFLGETAARKSEGLRLRWDNIDFANSQVTIDGPTKNAKCRYIPLTDFAIGYLRSLTRVVGCPLVFLKHDRTPWVGPRETCYKARTAAGLEWVGFHDPRHFRITQWVKHGVDLRTVKELAGHSDISTTMRYAHFAPKHASKLVREVERAELRELEEGLSEQQCSDFVPTSQSKG
ncbi:MAG: site-specific integrase [Acidobacteria bacterium]|nr:MAG: site-specific integrase [Acidobacteriota bacterium]